MDIKIKPLTAAILGAVVLAAVVFIVNVVVTTAIYIVAAGALGTGAYYAMNKGSLFDEVDVNTILKLEEKFNTKEVRAVLHLLERNHESSIHGYCVKSAQTNKYQGMQDDLEPLKRFIRTFLVTYQYSSPATREAMQDLFTGKIGRYINHMFSFSSLDEIKDTPGMAVYIKDELHKRIGG